MDNIKRKKIELSHIGDQYTLMQFWQVLSKSQDMNYTLELWTYVSTGVSFNSSAK